MTNTKARNAELAAAARAIAERHPEHGGKLLPLAKKMMAATGCSIDTAKRHIAKQFHLMRGEIVKADGRGGAREGAGFPEGVKRDGRRGKAKTDA